MRIKQFSRPRPHRNGPKSLYRYVKGLNTLRITITCLKGKCQNCLKTGLTFERWALNIQRSNVGFGVRLLVVPSSRNGHLNL